MGSAHRVTLCRQQTIYRRAVRTTRRHAAVFLDGRRDGRTAHLRYDFGVEGNRPPDVPVAHELAIHRLSCGSARLSDAAGLSNRRISDHGRGTAARDNDVLDAQPHQVPAQDCADGRARPRAGERDEETTVMTTVGIVTATLVGIALLVWLVDLVRQDRLYAGYGVIFVFGTLAAIVVLLVPPLLRLATAASVALLPVPSLSFVALVILTFLMVYVFIQISVLSNRVMRLTQVLAISSPQQQTQNGVEGVADRPQ